MTRSVFSASLSVTTIYPVSRTRLKYLTTVVLVQHSVFVPATELFSDALEDCEAKGADAGCVGALVAPVLWFASKGAFGYGELKSEPTKVFDLAEALAGASEANFADYSLEELNGIDVSTLTTKELELYTARMMALSDGEGLEDGDAVDAAAVAELAAEFDGDVPERRGLELEHDSVEDIDDALAQAALLASCAPASEDISSATSTICGGARVHCNTLAFALLSSHVLYQVTN